MITDILKCIRENATEEPAFGEKFSLGAKKGVYVGKCSPFLYAVVWEGDRHTSIIPSSCVHFSGEMDDDFIFDYIFQNGKVKGGVRVGPRKRVRNPAELAMKKKRRMMKKIRKPKPGAVT